MGRGGKRPGAGAKKKPWEFKKEQLNVKLPGWLKAWLRGQEQSNSVLIEDALCGHNKLLAPEVEKKERL